MRYLLFDGGTVETLSYFSKCIAVELHKHGKEVMVFDVVDETKRIPELIRFISEQPCTMIAFNFNGLQHEAIFYDDSYRLFWNLYHVKCINIIVDHPLYYYKELNSLPEDYVQLCIDKGHEDYMRKYYPKVRLLHWMSLAGSRPGQDRAQESERVEKNAGDVRSRLEKERTYLPMEERQYDLVFTGNYTPPKNFDKYIVGKGREYEDFYRGMIDDLLADPSQEMHTVFERHIKAELGELSAEDMTKAIHSLMFLDMYVRFHFRGEVVRRLVDGGQEIHVFGDGWQYLPVKQKKKLVCHGMQMSEGCLEAISHAKLSLNVMPWFKQGSHDRIYNSMYCGAVCITDGSRYLQKTLNDQENVIFYELEHMDKITEKVSTLLNNRDKLQQIADAGYRHVEEQHTWAQFTRQLLMNFYL